MTPQIETDDDLASIVEAVTTDCFDPETGEAEAERLASGGVSLKLTGPATVRTYDLDGWNVASILAYGNGGVRLKLVEVDD